MPYYSDRLRWIAQDPNKLDVLYDLDFFDNPKDTIPDRFYRIIHAAFVETAKLFLVAVREARGEEAGI